jgi:hypothetical protein
LQSLEWGDNDSGRRKAEQRLSSLISAKNRIMELFDDRISKFGCVVSNGEQCLGRAWSKHVQLTEVFRTGDSSWSAIPVLLRGIVEDLDGIISSDVTDWDAAQQSEFEKLAAFIKSGVKDGP